MNLTEQSKEDITDMTIESRDVGEELKAINKKCKELGWIDE